jgi:NADH:ubiquinone oxidoreductase subunit D/NADH:ubiquinone oxidoreductase subunit C
METNEILMQNIKNILNNFDIEYIEDYKKTWIKTKLKSALILVEVAKALKSEGLKSLVTVSPTDFIDENRIEMNYFFEDLNTNRNVWLKVDIPRELEKCEIDSLTPYFGGANWAEKEAYSVYGVKFIGHPELEFFLISQDYYGKFPFRKDFDWKAHEANLIENMNAIMDDFNDEVVQNEKNLDNFSSETTLNWGPTHPASGPIRLKIKSDGEEILSVKPDIGYVWRALEHLVEEKDFINSIVAVERICFMDNTNSMIGYSQAVEEIANKQITEFAEMMRVLLGEIGRIVSHLMGMSSFFNNMGLMTLFMWALDVREYFLDVLEEYSGARIATASIEPGGVRYPLNMKLLETLEKAIAKYEQTQSEINAIFINNPTMKLRASKVGIITKKEVEEFALCGIIARASGVKADVRLDEPYAGYSKIKMDYMLNENGSAMSRFEILFKEMNQSMLILKQAIADIRLGVKEERYNPEKDHLVKIPKKLPAGEAISRVEWSRGELLFHLVTKEKATSPYRLKIKAPSVNHTMMLDHLLRGETLSEIPLVFGSLYICQGDLDR